ncbi:MAG: hypothetical protein JAZ19_00580 [Candidatus Thiodiazotropha taylori]|nr:hypothetical protein [Candidatus Thiodiazotropha taylori]MCG7909122.1 hypothetical protein [Candidatus Thiodiazotropha taylori]MCG7974068.1 hypothetical protein [Candidatus Thiodiazotropha taylori]MCG7994295.1 hypothetical protein [Candidatus Thiodiazotropha taylori]MCG8035506.1 hypothetical protein [Candidatus Thiodiazotropha taylori]
MSSNDPLNQSMQNDIAKLEGKRKILQQIVEITNALESMQESLNAVLVLGVASKDLPEDALNLYSSLSGSLRNLPIKQVQLYYSNLETLIKSQLEKIMQYSGLDYSKDENIEFISLSSDDEEASENPLDMLDEFKRTAQTAVSMRVLLRKRGVATPGATIPVSPEVIKRQLVDLDNQEKQQRKEAGEKIQEMQADVQGMLDNPDYPDGMKEILKGVVSNLEQDKKLLNAGASLCKLSFVAEAEEIVDVQDVEVEETIEITGVAEPADESDFSERASRWLNSPWDVSWKDTADR